MIYFFGEKDCYEKKLYFLMGFFSIIFTFLIFNNITVSAATAISASDFDDGITNWRASGNNQIAEIPIANNLKLGYAFGLASNTSNQIPSSYLTSGPDSSITNNSVAAGMNLYFSKMNIFLDDGGNYISSVFQGSNSASNATTLNQQNVSTTSPGFMISPENSTSLNGRTGSAFSILGSPDSYGSTGNAGMTSKHFYIGSDKNGNPAYKIVGNFSRTNNSGYKNGTYNMEIELLLRASPSNSAIVQREMYVKNTASTDASFVTLFGEDTKLGSSNNGISNDHVPIWDLGNKQGLYIQDIYSSKEYRLMTTNQLPDGFDSYNGQAMSTNWTSGLSGGVPSGTGAEVNDNPKGTQLTASAVDSSYILKWNEKTLKPNETAHFGSTMGVTAKPYSIPTPTKTYTNETRSDGTNRVGDKLKFSLKLVNNGYGAKWNSQQIVDQIPKGLQIDTSSITRSYNGTAASQPDPTDYDSTTRKLTFPMPFQLTDDQYETVTFEATLTNDALSNLNESGNLVNSAEFLGSDYMVSPTIIDTFNASVDIPVQAADFNSSFTKQVKNISNNEDYQNSTTGKKGDKIGYLITYSVAPSSKDYLVSATTINDEVPSGLEVDLSSIQAKGTTGDWYNQTWGMNVGAVGPIKAGQNVQLRFEATVTANSAGTITNNAYITNVKTSAGQTYSKVLTNDADLNVQNVNTFLNVPNLIDFGSTNVYGKAKTLTNVKTNGELIVSHPNSNNFNVNVSYDNDDATSQLKTTDGKTLPSDDSGLIFIKQRTSSSDDVGTWQPISPTGTPIQTSDFAGNQQSLQLTNYVGVNNWKLKLAPTVETGSYSGTLTWTMSESV